MGEHEVRNTVQYLCIFAMGLSLGAGFILMALRFAGIIQFSWWLVTMPLYVPTLVVLLGFVSMFIALKFVSDIGKPLDVELDDVFKR